MSFRNPGYTITGNSLALANASAITNDADAVISGAIVSGTLNNWGPGILTLSGANTYSGGTFVNAGVLRLSSDAALGAVPVIPATNVTLNGGQLCNTSSPSLHAYRTILLGAGGGFLESSGVNTLTVNGQLTGAAGLGVVWDSGTVVLSGVNNYTGATTIGVTGNAYSNSASANPTLQLGSSTALPGTDLIFGTSANANTATLDLHGLNATVAAVTGGPNAIVDNLGGGAGMLIVGNNGASSTFGGVIRNTSGTVSLNKIGAGTFTLSGANTFTGQAVVSAGTLALSSSGSLAGPVNIGAGATFDVSAAGSGTYSPPSGAAVMAGGTASPANLRGASGGTANLGSNHLVLAYDGSNPALTISQGALSLNGNTITVNSPSTLGEGNYPLIQVTGGSLITNGTFTVNGTGIAHGYRRALIVSGGQLILNLVKISTPSFTTMGPFAPSQTYGSVTLRATVSPANATNTVTFYEGTTALGTGTLDGTTGTAVCTPVASLLPVAGSPHQITASYEGDDNYAGSSSSTSSNLTITAKTVTLGGSKTYDKSATITPSQGLSIVNNLDGGNLYLSPSWGTAWLAGQNVGTQAIRSIISTNTTPARVQSATNFNNSGGTGMTVALKHPPADGNTLIAVIATMGHATDVVTVSSTNNIGGTQTWYRAASAYIPAPPLTSVDGAETEVWYAPNVLSASTNVSIAWNLLISGAAVVMEYSGLLTDSPSDQTATATGNNSSPTTGTTATTTQPNELWIGAICIQGDSVTLNATNNGFTVYDRITNWHWYNGLFNDYYISAYTLDKVVTATGAANTGGSLNSGTYWAGAIATFKAASYYTYTTNLALAGPAATSYTLVPTGTVTINQRPVTVAAVNTSKTYDGTTTSAGAATGSGLASGDTCNPASPGQSFSSRNAAAGSAVIIPAAITINDGNGGNNYTVTYSNCTAGVIARTNLTVTAASNTKTYDGTTSAAAHPTITAGSIQPGDAAPIWTETYATKNGGTGKTLIPAGLVNDGNGGANYSCTYAPDFTGVITALPTSTLLSSGINPSGFTTNVTFTATVNSVPPMPDLPTGNVVFSANGTPFATNGLLSGSITASTTSLPVGTNSITAQYLGDGSFQASLSSTLAQVVTNSVIYSTTNIFTSITNNHNGTFTLYMRGTPGAAYYVVTNANLRASMTLWRPVPGSTNNAGGDGKWSCLVSNSAPAYYRPIAVNPAP